MFISKETEASSHVHRARMPWGESPEKALFQNSQSQFEFWPQTSPTAEPIAMVLENGTFELHPEGRDFFI